MQKLTLNPDMLRVESFSPDAAADDAMGTVRGHSYVTVDGRLCSSDDQTVQCGPSDYGWETCAGASCLEKCALSYDTPVCES